MDDLPAEISRLEDALLRCASAPCYRIDVRLGVVITCEAQRIAREALRINVAAEDIPLRTLPGWTK